jgi:hypothetical protein
MAKESYSDRGREVGDMFNRELGGYLPDELELAKLLWNDETFKEYGHAETPDYAIMCREVLSDKTLIRAHKHTITRAIRTICRGYRSLAYHENLQEIKIRDIRDMNISQLRYFNEIGEEFAYFLKTAFEKCW